MPSSPSPATRLQSLWRRLAPLPGGRWLFSRIFGWMVPYSGSIRPRVTHLEPGHARVTMDDRRRVRNHLASVHAVALANLGEAASGLAVVGALPPTARGIVVGLDVTYAKKARGPLVAECRAVVPQVTESMEHTVSVEVRDAAGDVVATVRARWLLGPVPPREEAG
ncbi:MAG: hypothetical protein AMXMBFR53_23890 [Gemmatimonadota bacterium]